MGMTHLKKIAERFQSGRSFDEPMALIQEATTANQKIVIGTAGDICERAAANDISSPAVIVIGKVVNESDLTTLLVAATVESLPKFD